MSTQIKYSVKLKQDLEFLLKYCGDTTITPSGKVRIFQDDKLIIRGILSINQPDLPGEFCYSGILVQIRMSYTSRIDVCAIFALSIPEEEKNLKAVYWWTAGQDLPELGIDAFSGDEHFVNQAILKAFCRSGRWTRYVEFLRDEVDAKIKRFTEETIDRVDDLDLFPSMGQFGR